MPRLIFERLLRAIAIIVLGVLLWWAVRPTAPHLTAAADSAALDRALARWSTVQQPTAVHARLDAVPSAAERDWLAALPGAGTRVTWQHGPLAPVAETAEPVADPAGGTLVRVAAPAGSRVVVGDVAGPVDSVEVGDRPGATVMVPAAGPSVSASVGRTTARSSVRDSLVLKRVLVLAQAGWEARFVVDALEERGWRVDAEIGLGPGRDVVAGVERTAPPAIDTSRYAAVIALDSTAARYAGRIARYVSNGGGLVVADSAAGPFGTLVPGLASRGPDAVVLELRDGQARVVARRIGPGRVVEIGYNDTWRWRMTLDSGVMRHRAWWANVVSQVAYAPATRRLAAPDDDPAPIVRLTDRLGAATEARAAPDASDEQRWRKFLFAGVLLALLAEWVSRRLRGRR